MKIFSIIRTSRLLGDRLTQTNVPRFIAVLALFGFISACDSESLTTPAVIRAQSGVVTTLDVPVENQIASDDSYESAVPPAVADRAVKLLPIGDSITVGQGSCSYRTPLVQRLQNNSVEFFGKVGDVGGVDSEGCVETNFEHEGRAGSRTFEWLEPDGSNQSRAFGLANVWQPDIVLLHIGSNDINRGELVGVFDQITGVGTETIGRIDELLDDIFTGSPGTAIYVADLVPWLADPLIDANIDLLREEIHKLVAYRKASGDKVALARVYEGFQPGMLQIDGVHPNAAGDTHIANKFLEAMQSDGFFLGVEGTAKVRIEAESGALTGKMRAGNDGSGYVATYFASGYQSDYVTLDFTVEDAGLYRVLGRVKGTTTEANSLFFQLGSGEIVNWGIPATGDYVTDYVAGSQRYYAYLSAGAHSARIYNRRLDARVDWVEFQHLGASSQGDVDGDGVVNIEDSHPNDKTRL